MRPAKAFAGPAMIAASLALTYAPGAMAQRAPAATCYDVETTESCTAELAGLCAEIESSESLKQRDIESMISKVVGASIKLNQDKAADAEQKLAEIGEKVDTLATAPKSKISDDDANAISGALTAAELCVVSNY